MSAFQLNLTSWSSHNLSNLPLKLFTDSVLTINPDICWNFEVGLVIRLGAAAFFDALAMMTSNLLTT